MKNNYKAAIVGCGGIAQLHGKVLSGMENIKMVAFCDIKIERANDFQKLYGGNVYTSYEEMIENEEIDVLHICAPHYLHTPIAVACSKKNIKVFSEKPPVISYEQWEELSSIKTTLGICFQNRYNSNNMRMKELIESGVAGKVLGARAFVTWSRDEKYYTESGWRGSLETEGGGVLINQSIHTLDLLVHLIGKPVYCDASCHNRHLKGVIEVEDTMEAYVKFEGENVKEGAAAIFYATTAYSCDSSVLLEIHCENMTLKTDGEELFITMKDGTKTVETFENNHEIAGKNYWGRGHFSCIEHFYNAVDENKPAPIGIPEITETTKLMLDIYKSARSK